MDSIFEKIGNQRTLSQEIEQKIEDAILKRKLIIGQKLPTEKDLCEMFGVSRTAIREALRSLSARGLVSIRKGDGIYVNDYSEAHANKSMSIYLELKFDKNYPLHLVRIRQMVEPQIARKKKKKRTEVDILALEKNLNEFVNAESGSETYAMLDLEYHKLISKATANPLIPLIMDPLFSLMPKVKTLIVSRLKHTKLTNATNYHQIIFEKIRNKDTDGAYEAMISHLQIAEQDTLKLMDCLENDDELF